MRGILLLIIAISLSSAATVGISASTGYSGSTAVAIQAQFPDSWGKQECINVSGQPYGIVVKDQSGLILGSQALAAGNLTSICAIVPSDYLQFDFSSNSYTSKEGALWAFDFVLGLSQNISDLNASLTLPPGAVLRSTNGAVQEEGSSLLVLWSGKDIDTSRRVHLRASYDLGTQQQDNTLLLLIVAAAVVAAACVLFFMRKPAPRQAPSAPAPPGLEANAVFATLDETDREIVREITSQGGKTTQAHLYLHTHVPKATLSRRLASLENRGIVRKSQKGNRNLVTLGDALQK